MHRYVTAVLLAGLMLPAGSWAQTSPTGRPAPAIHDSAELRGIRSSERLRFDLMIKADTLALRRYLAEELEYTHSNGIVEDKPAHLGSIGARHTVYRSLEPSEFRYRRYGSTLVGTGRVQSRGELAGTPFDVVLRVGTVHVWRDGRWQLVMWQSTRVP
jgi:hypothetical protein